MENSFKVVANTHIIPSQLHECNDDDCIDVENDEVLVLPIETLPDLPDPFTEETR